MLSELRQNKTAVLDEEEENPATKKKAYRPSFVLDTGFEPPQKPAPAVVPPTPASADPRPTMQQQLEAIGADRYQLQLTQMGVDGRSRTRHLVVDEGQPGGVRLAMGPQGGEQGYTSAQLEAMREMLVKHRKDGWTVHATPVSEDRDYVVLQNVAAERLQGLEHAGHEPALIQSVGADQHQVVLLVDKGHGARMQRSLQARFGGVEQIPIQAYSIEVIRAKASEPEAGWPSAPKAEPKEAKGPQEVPAPVQKVAHNELKKPSFEPEPEAVTQEQRAGLVSRTWVRPPHPDTLDVALAVSGERAMGLQTREGYGRLEDEDIAAGMLTRGVSDVETQSWLASRSQIAVQTRDPLAAAQKMLESAKASVHIAQLDTGTPGWRSEAGQVLTEAGFSRYAAISAIGRRGSEGSHSDVQKEIAKAASVVGNPESPTYISFVAKVTEAFVGEGKDSIPDVPARHRKEGAVLNREIQAATTHAKRYEGHPEHAQMAAVEVAVHLRSAGYPFGTVERVLGRDKETTAVAFEVMDAATALKGLGDLPSDADASRRTQAAHLVSNDFDPMVARLALVREESPRTPIQVARRRAQEAVGAALAPASPVPAGVSEPESPAKDPKSQEAGRFSEHPQLVASQTVMRGLAEGQSWSEVERAIPDKEVAYLALEVADAALHLGTLTENTRGRQRASSLKEAGFRDEVSTLALVLYSPPDVSVDVAFTQAQADLKAVGSGKEAAVASQPNLSDVELSRRYRLLEGKLAERVDPEFQPTDVAVDAAVKEEMLERGMKEADVERATRLVNHSTSGYIRMHQPSASVDGPEVDR